MLREVARFQVFGGFIQVGGAVSLTLKVLHFEGCKPLVEKVFYETAIV